MQADTVLRLVLSALCLGLIQQGVSPDWSLSLIGLLICAMTLHECAHAAVALWLGDDTASRAGRLSLHPLDHIDFVFFEPVPIAVERLRGGRWGRAAVMLAGPAVNFLLLGLVLLVPSGSLWWQVGAINGVIGAFNLLPIPPLDGFRAIVYAGMRA